MTVSDGKGPSKRPRKRTARKAKQKPQRPAASKPFVVVVHGDGTYGPFPHLKAAKDWVHRADLRTSTGTVAHISYCRLKAPPCPVHGVVLSYAP